jgi:hypothetical protein
MAGDARRKQATGQSCPPGGRSRGPAGVIEYDVGHFLIDEFDFVWNAETKPSNGVEFGGGART